MNFFIDIYDLLIRAIAYSIAFPFTETFILSFGSYYLIKKMGGAKFLWIKLRSLRHVSDEDQGLDRSKRFRFLNDIIKISLVFVVCVKGPLLMISLARMDLFFYKDYVYERTDDRYKLERDRLLEGAAMAGLPLFPYVWIPVVIGINKYRQWVDVETMVTWKYHENRSSCFWSGYTDSSCMYAMSIARALHRDDESLKIGKAFVEARKDNDPYHYCSALRALQSHAEEVDSMEMYKKLTRERCESGCSKGCEDHKYAQVLPGYRLRNKFSDRQDPSSFL